MRTRWFIASRRAHNRWLDFRGRLAGYCMATTWREHTEHGPDYAPGYSHWRCWLRRGHPAEHRFINYIWNDPGRGNGAGFSPLPTRNADDSGWFDGRGHGLPPSWGKHHGIARSGHSRRIGRYAERERARRYAERRRGDTGSGPE